MTVDDEDVSRTKSKNDLPRISTMKKEETNQLRFSDPPSPTKIEKSRPLWICGEKRVGSVDFSAFFQKAERNWPQQVKLWHVGGIHSEGPIFWSKKFQVIKSFCWSVVPLPRMPVITRILIFLVGDPYKPSFANVTGRGGQPKFCWSTDPDETSTKTWPPCRSWKNARVQVRLQMGIGSWQIFDFPGIDEVNVSHRIICILDNFFDLLTYSEGSCSTPKLEIEVFSLFGVQDHHSEAFQPCFLVCIIYCAVPDASGMEYVHTHTMKFNHILAL